MDHRFNSIKGGSPKPVWAGSDVSYMGWRVLWIKEYRARAGSSLRDARDAWDTGREMPSPYQNAFYRDARSVRRQVEDLIQEWRQTNVFRSEDILLHDRVRDQIMSLVTRAMDTEMAIVVQAFDDARAAVRIERNK